MLFHFASFSRKISGVNEMVKSALDKYSGISVALMARLPWLFKTHSSVPRKKSHSCRSEIHVT